MQQVRKWQQFDDLQILSISKYQFEVQTLPMAVFRTRNMGVWYFVL